MTNKFSYVLQMLEELEDMRDKWKDNILNGFGTVNDAVDDLDIWIKAERIRFGEL